MIIAAEKGSLKAVKMLLAHKCNLYATAKVKGQELYAWELASLKGNAQVAEYLNGCVGKENEIQK